MSDFLYKLAALGWAGGKQNPSIAEVVQDAREKSRIPIDKCVPRLIFQHWYHASNLQS